MVFGHLFLLESRGQGIPGVFFSASIWCSKNHGFPWPIQAKRCIFTEGKSKKTLGELSWAKVMGGLMAVIPASEVDSDGWAGWSFNAAAPVQV